MDSISWQSQGVKGFLFGGLGDHACAFYWWCSRYCCIERRPPARTEAIYSWVQSYWDENSHWVRSWVLTQKRFDCLLWAGEELLVQVEEFKYPVSRFMSGERLEWENARGIGAADAVAVCSVKKEAEREGETVDLLVDLLS